ncbi:hypothetical protein C8J56DRAFT_893728 [Mycena floridula]|nr:hypothetical protein C8J56DRAFT_893728 [Mycena floridula]
MSRSILLGPHLCVWELGLRGLLRCKLRLLVSSSDFSQIGPENNWKAQGANSRSKSVPESAPTELRMSSRSAYPTGLSPLGKLVTVARISRNRTFDGRDSGCPKSPVSAEFTSSLHDYAENYLQPGLIPLRTLNIRQRPFDGTSIVTVDQIFQCARNHIGAQTWILFVASFNCGVLYQFTPPVQYHKSLIWRNLSKPKAQSVFGTFGQVRQMMALHPSTGTSARSLDLVYKPARVHHTRGNF